jgi:glycosyltransferase involved in cell wall biosynthesis
MVRRWVEAGAEVTVITAMPNRPEGRIHAEWRGRMFGEEHLDGARVLRSWLYCRPGGGFITTLLNNLTFAKTATLHALRRAGPFDVLIASSPPWFPLPAGDFLARHWKIPLVLELRDLWPDYLVEMGVLRPRFVARAVQRWDRRLLGRASRLVTVTEPLREVLLTKGLPADRIEVISNGVDPEEYFPSTEPAPDPALERRPGEFLVGYLGNFGAGQRLDVVLAAAARLAGPAPQIRFVLAGDGTDYPRIQRRVTDERPANLTLLGTIAKARTRAFYNRCDTCLVPLAPLPLFAHALPTKLFEIMACGRPVVASATGSVAAVLRESGAGVASVPGDAAGLAEAIRGLASSSNDHLAAMGAAGTEYVATHFHRGVLADRYLALLRAMAAEGGRQR